MNHVLRTRSDANPLLLSACLAHDDAAARAAFERWQREFDIDDIDGGGFMLLPLLESRLAQLGVEHPWRGRMQGVARKARVEHALNFAAACAAQQTLQQAGVDAAVLGASFDVPLLLEKIALYVAFRERRTARTVLAAAGWQAEPAKNASLRALLPIDWRSGVALRSGDGRRLTLRWLLLDARPSPAIDAAMRARASQSAQEIRCAPADVFLQAALRRPLAPGSIALACLALRHCDAAALDELQHTAAALDARKTITEMLHICEDLTAGRLLRLPSHSPFRRLREAAHRRIARMKLTTES